MGQMFVGIMLNAAMHRGVPRLKTGQESLSNYEEGAAIFGLTPCFLKLADIDTHSGYSYAYIKGTQGYQKTVIPTPEVIHNRAIYSQDSPGIKKLLLHGPIIFNACNRYGKDEIHRLLQINKNLKLFLPVTEQGLSGLKEMMNRFPDLILKPCRGSIGNGVMRLFHTGSKTWNLIYRPPGSARWVRVAVDQAALPRSLLSRLASTPYLVQERIPLVQIGDRPFDLRVTVQKGWGGQWHVTGSYAKLAAPGGFISNIAQGGEALDSSYALGRIFSGETAARIRMAVSQLGLAVARQLDLYLPGLGDIGLDIGVTSDGRLFFIECNGRDQRYGFQKAGLTDIWKSSYYRPMGYARFLLENG